MNFGSVLVLDSHPAQAKQISHMLEKHKWSSVLCVDKNMAYQLLKSRRFHLMLFDAYVGGVNIMNHVSEIKSHGGKTPLAIMSDEQFGQRAVITTLDLARQAGADFTITKPFSPGQLKNLLDDTSAFNRRHKSQYHVLVIDADRDFREKTVRNLRSLNYFVKEADSWEAAFKHHNLGLMDIVVTTILMGGMGGIEGIKQASKAFPHLQIVATSESVDKKMDANQILAAAIHVGAHAQLAKPYTTEALSLKLQSLELAALEAA